MKKAEQTSINNILDNTHLLSMATIKEGTSYINTAFFAYDDIYNLYYLSPSDSQHSLNIKENNSVAVTVFDSHLTFSNKLSGLQMFGTAQQAKGKDLLKGFLLYEKRFSIFGEEIKRPIDLKIWHTRMYVI